MVNQNIKIYEDEGGVSYHNGSLPLKMLGGVSLLIVGLYGLVSISAKYSNSYQKNKAEHSNDYHENRVEELIWTIILFLMLETITKKINYWKKNNLYQRNKPLFIALMPLVLLSILMIIFLLFDKPEILVTVMISLFPSIISFIAVLLLRKLWLSTSVSVLIKKIGTTMLTIIWLVVFLLLVLTLTMSWDIYIKTDPIYILIDSLFLLANGYSFIWTWIDLGKKDKRIY